MYIYFVHVCCVLFTLHLTAPFDIKITIICIVDNVINNIIINMLIMYMNTCRWEGFLISRKFCATDAEMRSSVILETKR